MHPLQRHPTRRAQRGSGAEDPASWQGRVYLENRQTDWWAQSHWKYWSKTLRGFIIFGWRLTTGFITRWHISYYVHLAQKQYTRSSITYHPWLAGTSRCPILAQWHLELANSTAFNFEPANRKRVRILRPATDWVSCTSKSICMYAPGLLERQLISMMVKLHGEHALSWVRATQKTKKNTKKKLFRRLAWLNLRV